MGWNRKRRGWSDIWTHPDLDRAVVDTRGLGMNARIAFDGEEFDTLAQAKRFALSTVPKKPDSANLQEHETIPPLRS